MFGYKSSMATNYHIQFFGKGVDIYFQARSSYEVTPLLFQSMYLAFFRRLVVHFRFFNFQAISTSIRFSIKSFFCLYIYMGSCNIFMISLLSIDEIWLESFFIFTISSSNLCSRCSYSLWLAPLIYWAISSQCNQKKFDWLLMQNKNLTKYTKGANSLQINIENVVKDK
jgi:hypothetical protein